jgi:RNA 3'-terminal phosphate cyclase (ATP)
VLEIDGSLGEGGGQVLRTALGLSLVTGTPFRMRRIRAGRERPGVFPGAYELDVGTAGSTTLVLQAVLPALLAAPAPTRLALVGGTHNPMAPTFEFLARAFLPLVERAGPRIEARLLRAGFYPVGGGRCEFDVAPAARLAPFDLLERGRLRSRRATAALAALPEHVAARELDVVRRRLGWTDADLRVETLRGTASPGNVLTLEVESEHVTEVFAAVGERGKRAEDVAREAVLEAMAYLAAGVPVGPHLADQLLVPMALAGGGSFRTLEPTLHARTNAEVVALFLPVRVEFAREEGAAFRVGVRPL